jgi:hypothetical protein
MAFKYKKLRRAIDRFPSHKPKIANEGEEPLSGYFAGLPAKRDEEFFMQEASRMPSVRNVEFRMAIGAPKGLPGWLELDGLLETYSGYRAFEIDDMSFVHLGQREDAETKVKDLRRIEGLKQKGVFVDKIEHLDAADLTTREQARQLLRKLNI